MVATRASLCSDLRGLGVNEDDIIMVHSSVRSVGPVAGGVNTIVQALLDSCETLVCYVDWELGFEDDPAPELLDAIPVFDKRTARAARSNGILPEVVRTWPGAYRSDNPDAGVAAIGKRAEWLCADHALDYGYGAGSPFAKLVSADAKIVLLGAPLDTITLLHHAESMANIPGKRVKKYRRKLSIQGEPQWIDIEEFDTADPVVDGMPEDHFALIAEAALAGGAGRAGRVGAAQTHIFDARALHDTAVRWLENWTQQPELRS